MATLSGVFQMQADIASRVAEALDVALGGAARTSLAEKPTTTSRHMTRFCEASN